MFLAPFLPNRRPPTPWHVAPLLRYVAAMMTGIGAAWQGKEFIETKVWGLVALFSAILLLLHILINGLRKRRALTVGLSLLLIGVVSATWTQLDYEKTVFEWPSRPLYREGRVEHVQKRTKKGVQADLTIMVTENAERGRRVRAFIEDTCHTIVPGRQISFFVKVNKPQGAGNPGDFNYRDYLLTHRIGGTAYLPHAAWHVRKGVESTSLFQTFPSIRSLMLKSYADHFNADALAILSALTLGDKSLLTSEVKTLFSETGTSHVLALSGLHLGILFSLLNFFILARLKTYRFLFVSLTLLSIAGLWGFVALTGAPLSLQRAAWMFTIMQLAQCFRHTDVSSLNNLCIAAAILLISSPMSLLDVGFQLSFTAVLGISLANLYLWRRFPLPYWDYEADKLIRETPINLYSGYKRWFHRDTLLRLIRPFLRRAYNFFRHTIYPLITVSLSAQLATLPLVIYYFHVFSPYALLANFVVVPVAYLIIAGGILFFLLPFDPIRSIVASTMTFVINLMTTGLEGMNRLPGAVWRLYPTKITLAMLAVLPILLYLLIDERARCVRVKLIYTIGGLLIVSTASEIVRLHLEDIQPRLIVYNLPHTTAVHFLVSRDSSWIYSSSSPDTTRLQMERITQNYLRPHGIRQPLPLILKNLDNQHLIKRGETFVFGDETTIILRRNIAPLDSPKSLSLLIIGRGCRMKPEDLFRSLRPRQVVLDASLTPFYRQRLKNFCLKNALAVHDTETDGAYIHNLPRQ